MIKDTGMIGFILYQITIIYFPATHDNELSNYSIELSVQMDVPTGPP